MPITRASDSNLYTVGLRFGNSPGVNLDLIIATNTEWTLVTSVNCTLELGCPNAVYDARASPTSTVDPVNRIANATVGQSYFFSGRIASDALYFRNSVDMVDATFPFFAIESSGDQYMRP